jgi:hypothetical protein
MLETIQEVMHKNLGKKPSKARHCPNAVPLLVLASVVFLAAVSEGKADVESGESAIGKLRDLKASLEADIVALEDVEQHITQLARYYQTDPEGAFGARLPADECTARAGYEFCAALWPFYEFNTEAARPAGVHVREPGQ